MRILLVCMSGITTNVLANKLQAYGGQQGKKDFFLAYKIGLAEELLPGTDLILVAPQARFSAERIRAVAAGLGIPTCDLDEEDFVLGRLERIYEQVDAHRPASCSSQPEDGGRLGVGGFWRIGRDAFVSCVPFLALAAGAWLFHGFTGGELSYALWQAGAGVFSLYLLFAVGFHYGERIHGSRLQCGVTTMASPLLLLPTQGVKTAWLGSIRIVTGTIPLSFFALPYSPLLFALALFSVFLLERFKGVRFRAGGGFMPLAGNLTGTTLQCSCVFAFFLFLRSLLEWLARIH